MKHQWSIVFMFTITEADARKIGLSETDGRRAKAIADAAGPLMVANQFKFEGPHCFACERPWSIEEAKIPCPGDRVNHVAAPARLD